MSATLKLLQHIIIIYILQGVTWSSFTPSSC